MFDSAIQAMSETEVEPPVLEPKRGNASSKKHVQGFY